ncbi:hypothetical protein BS47DRAFT_1298819 [Hydnum rufescens UP504]|uniref:Actin-like ATPase domain-containing protein n=1 Tax=Hydnum rufescens UP504 TaxID=1448309 RepID=A0A9P6AT33_9AGAM|nr:hypothetical protein BS47DRAFT_1298819 [Hydnum rufescens UP504]
MKLYISVDFGATHSSVSYASSTNGKVIPIASWPGSSDRLRKIPTCLVYDDRGDLRAWGFRARDINLRRGWVRCEWQVVALYPGMFKLWLDLESAPSTICPSLPAGKQPADVIVDFLSSLWMVKHTLLCTVPNVSSSSDFAEIYLTVPASWDARRALSLREAAVKAGLVVQVSRKDMYWQERLHIIPETKASAIHSVPLTQFLPDRKFMICDAGGGTIDIATYNVTRVWGAPEIAEVCLRSGAYCGSLFLDIYFRELVRARLADHPSHLDEASLAHFLLTFSGAEKLRYKGSVDDKKMFHFRCLHPQNSNHPSVGLENGELIIPGHVLRHEVFDPVINQVIRTINRHMLGSRVHVDALLLVGGFVQNEYLFQRIKDEFKSAIPSIIRPTNGDTASNCGAARSGLYPTVISVIPSHSVVMRVRLPAEPEDKRMRPASVVTTGRTQFSKNRLQYIIKKGIGLQKGTRVDAQVGKFSVAPSDNIFETAIYVDKTMRYTDQGETKELCVCRVDLKDLPDFKEQARAPTSEGFYTEFELGFEMDTAEIRGELLYKGRKFGAVTFHLRS